MNPPLMQTIHELLGQDRTLGNKLAGSIATTLGVDNPLDGLKPERLEGLEEYELEALLAQLFTPTFPDRCACEAVLPLEGFPRSGQAALVAGLVEKGTACDLIFGDDRQRLTLPEVVIERYVRLLRLEGVVEPTTEAHFSGLDESERHRCLALARRRVWRSPVRRALLNTCLETMKRKDRFAVDKLEFLSEFVHTYHPNDVEGLLRALFNLVDAYHQDHEHPVFNEQLEEYQGGNIRSKYCGSEVKAYRLEMARALLEDFDKTPRHLDP